MKRTQITEKDIQVLKLLQDLPVDESGRVIAKLEDIKPENMSMAEFKEILQFVNDREITEEERAEVMQKLAEG